MDREKISIELRAGLRSNLSYREIMRGLSRLVMEEVLSDYNGNVCKAAVRLGMHRNTLSHHIAELKIDINDFKVRSENFRPTKKALTSGM